MDSCFKHKCHVLSNALPGNVVQRADTNLSNQEASYPWEQLKNTHDT